MKATTNEGRQLDLKPDAFDALRARVTGPALPPGEGGYEGSRTVWNAMIDRKPVVRCLVVSCVRFAGGHDLPVCIQGEGLDPAGLAAADGALMVDRSRPGRWVDPVTRVAHAQAGCRLGDVIGIEHVAAVAPFAGVVAERFPRRKSVAVPDAGRPGHTTLSTNARRKGDSGYPVSHAEHGDTPE